MNRGTLHVTARRLLCLELSALLVDWNGGWALAPDLSKERRSSTISDAVQGAGA